MARKSKNRRMKAASYSMALVVFLVLSAAAAAILQGMRERDMLVSQNDAERTMNELLTSLSNSADLDAAIDGNTVLRTKIIGIAIYSEDGGRSYSWGRTPKTVQERMPGEEKFGNAVRRYFANSSDRSIIVLFSLPKDIPLPPPIEQVKHSRASSQLFFDQLRANRVVYFEIYQPEYWVRRHAESIIFPMVEVVFAIIILSVRSLILRNEQYRRRIEEQENLVVLGTAASTIAHEIKNPLLSIRLQTRIIEKTRPSDFMQEIAIINKQVDRLSALSLRVGDYLRDPAGDARAVDPAEIAQEVGIRLCGRNILRTIGDVPRVRMDPERLRSVMENLVRNALESGGPAEEVAIEAGNSEGRARLDVVDRGLGIPSETAKKLFDPFFTTKSRGTGIGLSICRRFVLAAGGTVTLANRQGKGCVARVLLSAAEEKK